MLKISQKNEDEVILDLKKKQKKLYRPGINGCIGKSDVKKQWKLQAGEEWGSSENGKQRDLFGVTALRGY